MKNQQRRSRKKLLTALPFESILKANSNEKEKLIITGLIFAILFKVDFCMHEG
jgi:hypothetical protein